MKGVKRQLDVPDFVAVGQGLELEPRALLKNNLTNGIAERRAETAVLKRAVRLAMMRR